MKLSLKNLVMDGHPEEEAKLIMKAWRVARGTDMVGLATSSRALRTVSRNFLNPANANDPRFRAFHALVNNELEALTPAEIAFGDTPDSFREQHSAFCTAMFRGHQTRFIDRHEDETTEDYLDRAQKATVNVTRVVINALGKLYHKQPAREFPEGTPVPEHVQDRLREIWGSRIFNPTMIYTDKHCRLVGTVAVRPIYDPEIKGKIRLWVFLSHQLRVIVDEQHPWRALAVIERVSPFKSKGGVVTIWTATNQIEFEGNKVHIEEHGYGGLPHVFCRDSLSFDSFFVEGRGRILCEPNAVLNNDLSDFEEVKQMQGFSVMEIHNSDTKNKRIGPREAFEFKSAEGDTRKQGVEFKSPRSPLAELRTDIEAQLRRIFGTNGVPPAAAFGAEIDRRSLSGTAIEAAMQPIQDDLESRASLFEPLEWDLADAAMRVTAAHEPEFVYSASVMAPEFNINYRELEVPKSTKDKISQDDFDISTGRTTPAQTMRRDDPEQFPTDQDAIDKWTKNLDETASAGFALERQADNPNPAFEESETPILDHLEKNGWIEHTPEAVRAD